MQIKSKSSPDDPKDAAVTASKSSKSHEAEILDEANLGDGSQQVGRFMRTENASKCRTTGPDGNPVDGDEDCDSLEAIRRWIYPVAAFSMIVLAVFAVCYSLYFCKAVMLPIVGAFLLNFLFGPVVARLKKMKIPNAIGALAVLGSVFGGLAIALVFAYDPATTWLADKDKNLAIVNEKLGALRQPIQSIREVSDQIDQITNGNADPGSDSSEESSLDQSNDQSSNDESHLEPSENIPFVKKETTSASESGEVPDNLEKAPVIPVEVQQPSISNRIFSTTGDAFVGISLMMVLLFYLLSAGDRGLEKLVKLMPTFNDKKRIVELTRAIEKSVSAYLMTTTMINAVLGLVIGAGMWAIGMPNPILWGIMAMLLNYFPFVGAIAGALIVSLVAIISFDSMAYVLWAPAIYLGANLIEANFITPVLLGRSVSLHPVWLMIFFVVVSWVWGLGGAIIAVPALAVIKITCDHVEPLMPIGEFLGR